MTAVASAASAVLERERKTFRSRTPRSCERYERALDVFPGGDTRLVTFYPPYPVAIERGQGIDLVDLDGNHYADFLLNYTSMIAGHRHPAVLEAVGEALTKLTGVAAPVPGQVELAAELIGRVESVEKVRFTNSGTESMQIALWAARAFTGRSTLVKAIGGYHGSIPELDRNIRPGFLPAGLPPTAPVIAVPFNDVEALRAAIDAAGDDLAALVLEPVLGSGGVIAPEPGYLESAETWVREAGGLFVLDEVISFRLSPGGYQRIAGLRPDITAFAKIIGGGFPVGAIGGRAEVMDVFRPGSPRAVGHSGTFNGNPVTVAAGRRTMELMDDAAYEKIDRLGAMLAEGLREAAERAGAGAQVTQVGSLLNVHFTTEPLRDFDAAQGVDPVAASAYHIGLLNRGVFVAPRGMMAISIVAEESDVQKVIDASADVFSALA